MKRYLRDYWNMNEDLAFFHGVKWAVVFAIPLWVGIIYAIMLLIA